MEGSLQQNEKGIMTLSDIDGVGSFYLRMVSFIEGDGGTAILGVPRTTERGKLGRRVGFLAKRA